jgi:hypothetical protein
LAPLLGRKKISARGVSRFQSFTLLLFCFILFLLGSFYQKYKKFSSFIVVIFTCLLFSLARMSNPEVEVRSFKQQGGESLKDAWYRISKAHHRCTKKHSTMILLRNFYVGISSWNRYILDTLAGGNFLGTPALEACTLIESLMGVPPINVVKTEITLEEFLEKLSSSEKSLPNILDNASQVNESTESRDFYFRALGSLVVLSFPQLLSFSSVLSKPMSETLTSAGTAGCPTGQQL